MTPARLDEAACARIPAAALAQLGTLRARPDVRALPHGEVLHVFFPPGDPDAIGRLLAIPGAELFARREEGWFRAGSLLPASGIPDPGQAVLLPRLLSPAPVRPETVVGPPERVPITLARDDHPRPTSALRCTLAALAEWADVATTHQLSGLTAALGPGGAVLLRGSHLPSLPGAERFWGERLLVPLGWRPEPALAEAVLLAALNAADADLVLLRGHGAERMPGAALGPVSRAGVRLAMRGAS